MGILVFFNHIGKKKITSDPTPIQVEMRKYEQDVDMAFIENAEERGMNTMFLRHIFYGGPLRQPAALRFLPERLRFFW